MTSKIYKEVFSSKIALTDKNLRNFCEKNDLKYNLVELSELTDLSDIPKYTFVYTGSSKNDANNGYTHHWLYLCGSYLFDSFGFQSKYKINKNIKSIITYPRQLQEFNSDVCGEYCAAFAHFCQKENKIDYTNIGVDFQNRYGLSANKKENDITILRWFKKKS